MVAINQRTHSAYLFVILVVFFHINFFLFLAGEERHHAATLGLLLLLRFLRRSVQCKRAHQLIQVTIKTKR